MTCISSRTQLGTTFSSFPLALTTALFWFMHCGNARLELGNNLRSGSQNTWLEDTLMMASDSLESRRHHT
jgi:hypothetical protein